MKTERNPAWYGKGADREPRIGDWVRWDGDFHKRVWLVTCTDGITITNSDDETLSPYLSALTLLLPAPKYHPGQQVWCKGASYKIKSCIGNSIEWEYYLYPAPPGVPEFDSIPESELSPTPPPKPLTVAGQVIEFAEDSWLRLDAEVISPGALRVLANATPEELTALLDAYRARKEQGP